MKGAIAGDVIGSYYEEFPVKSEDFELLNEVSTFTDGTVLSIATADALLHGIPYVEAYRKWGNRYPEAGFGVRFRHWLANEQAKPFYSLGNGAAMRVSPIAMALDELQAVEKEAEKCALVTHTHPEAVKGAKAVAAAIFMAKTDTPKPQIKSYLEVTYGYKLEQDFDELRREHSYNVSAPGSVPPALIAFFIADDFEDAIRKAISLGGDSDTQANIAAAVAYAFYKKIPKDLMNAVEERLPLPMQGIMNHFNQFYNIRY